MTSQEIVAGKTLKHEVGTFAFYAFFAVAAIFGPFVLAAVRQEFFPPTCQGQDCAQGVNLSDVWENEKVIFYVQLLIFTALALLRLLVLFAAKRRFGYR